MRNKIIAAVLLPEILLVLFFGWAYVVSPPDGGEEIARAAGLPYKAVVAHRGASFYAPEETRPAYLLARAMAPDYLEMDVQRTKDGVLIAFHDHTPARTTNVAEVFPGRENDPVGDFTWAELQRLDAGSWFNAKRPEFARESYVGLKIIRLQDFLEIAAGHPRSPKPGIYIETKSPERYPGIEKELVDALRAAGWIDGQRPPGKVILQSFNKDSLARLKELAPNVPRVYLVNARMEEAEGWETLVARASELGQGIGPVGYLGWPWYTGPAHEAGLVVHPYTLNPPFLMWLVSHFGADGFFTDRPDLGLQNFDRAEGIDREGILKSFDY